MTIQFQVTWLLFMKQLPDELQIENSHGPFQIFRHSKKSNKHQGAWLVIAAILSPIFAKPINKT